VKAKRCVQPSLKSLASHSGWSTFPLVQEGLTWTGITITGTSVGTRAQMRRRMDLRAAIPLRSELELILLQAISDAVTTLPRVNAKGRFCVA